jgi:hypothetical protein
MATFSNTINFPSVRLKCQKYPHGNKDFFICSDKLSGGCGEGESKRRELEHEINVLTKREAEVDGYIRMAEQGLKVASDDKRWGYLTHADIRSIPAYKERTLLLIKAPSTTALTVPPVEEVSCF